VLPFYALLSSSCQPAPTHRGSLTPLWASGLPLPRRQLRPVTCDERRMEPASWTGDALQDKSRQSPLVTGLPPWAEAPQTRPPPGRRAWKKGGSVHDCETRQKPSRDRRRERRIPGHRWCTLPLPGLVQRSFTVCTDSGNFLMRCPGVHLQGSSSSIIREDMTMELSALSCTPN